MGRRKKTKMKQLILDKNHNYFIDDRKVFGVNEILQKTGIIDMGNIPEDVLKNACEFGTNVHIATALDDVNNLNYETLSPAILPYLESWQEFKKAYDINYKKNEIEVMLYSKKYNFAGTLDRLPKKIKNEYVLIDIKTNSGTLSKYYALTTIAYQLLIEENFKIKIKRRWCIQIKPNGYKIHQYENNIDRYYFLSLVKALECKENYK